MNIKNLVLGVGIFIVFLFVLHNGIRAFYSAPLYENYCNSSVFQMSYPEKFPAIATNCTYTNEIRNQESACYNNKGQPVYEYDKNGCTARVKKCNYCQKYFDDAQQAYNKTAFIISLIVGIIVLIVGYAILSVEPVGSALMASGVGSIVYGSALNWGNLGYEMKFVLLLIALFVLVLIALRLNKAVSENKKKR